MKDNCFLQPAGRASIRFHTLRHCLRPVGAGWIHAVAPLMRRGEMHEATGCTVNTAINLGPVSRSPVQRGRISPHRASRVTDCQSTAYGLQQQAPARMRPDVAGRLWTRYFASRVLCVQASCAAVSPCMMFLQIGAQIIAAVPSRPAQRSVACKNPDLER